MPMDAVTRVPHPVNEPVKQYAPGSPERASLEARLKEVAGERVDLTMTIGGRQRRGGGEPIDVVMPHKHRHVLGTMHNATAGDVRDAVDAARAAAGDWRRLPVGDPAAVFLPAADPPAGPR